MNYWLHRSNEWRAHTGRELEDDIIEAVLQLVERADLDDMDSTTCGDGSETEDSFSDVFQLKE